MAAVKIVVIGASRVFAPTIVADLWHAREDLAGSTIALCDIDADTLGVTTRVVERMVTERDMPYKIESSADRRDLLPGADYVIVAIALDHRRLWTIDLDIAETHGMVLTTGDTVGPGGWSRALRTVPPIQAIAEDMEELCPDAWLFNYTNPMCAICRTLAKTTNLKVVGLCHGIEGTTKRLAQFLDLPAQDISVRAAGINHLQWILDLRRNGTDLYPALKAAERSPASERLDVSWDLMELYGLFPSPGDRHVSEFFPWYCRPSGNGQLPRGLFRFDMDEYFDRGAEVQRRFTEIASGSAPLPDSLFKPTSEKAVKLIAALAADRSGSYHVNIPNHDSIGNLAPSANVEVPAWFDASGMSRESIGSIPEPIAGRCVHGSTSSSCLPTRSSSAIETWPCWPCSPTAQSWTLTSAWPWAASSWMRTRPTCSSITKPQGEDQRSMPFVDPATANNLSSDAIASIKLRNGSGTWRERISATNEHRTVLLHWPPGTAQAAHYHPACEEVFVIHEGCAEFTFNDDEPVQAHPGAVLYAPRRSRHSVRVVGDEPLLMMCFLAPNLSDDEIPA